MTIAAAAAAAIPESTQRDDQAAVEKSPMPTWPTARERSSRSLHVCQPALHSKTFCSNDINM